MQATTEWITGGVMIPELLRAAPQVRPVLDRYGLRGCGGPEGPAESLELFARAHEGPLPALLAELRAAGAAPAPTLPLPLTPTEKPAPADAIYRPFFKAGLLVTLTAGAAWGAYLLWRIAAMPMPRHGVAGAVIGNRFYLASGMIQSAGVLKVWRRV